MWKKTEISFPCMNLFKFWSTIPNSRWDLYKISTLRTRYESRVTPDHGIRGRTSWEAAKRMSLPRGNESFNRTMWAAWRANKAWHDRSVYLFSVSHGGIISRPDFRYLPIFSAEFTRVSGGPRSVARGVTLYNRGWLPFDKPPLCCF